MDATIEHFLENDLSARPAHSRFFKGVLAIVTISKDDPEKSDILQLGDTVFLDAVLPKCFLCQKPGHKRSDCPTRITCRKCQGSGHKANECPNLRCNNCLVVGHIAANCPKPRQKKHKERQRDAGDKKCSNCGSELHTLRDCFAGPSESLKASLGKKQTEDNEKDREDKSEDNDTISDIISDTISDTQDNTEKPESDPVDPPVEQMELLDCQGMTIRLETIIQNEHASSMSICFDTTFASNENRSGMVHRTAAARFTAANLLTKPTYEKVDLDNPELDTFMAPAAAARFKEFLAQASKTDTEQSFLYRVSFVFGQTSTNDKPKRLGRAFYADGDFGPFTTQVHAARDKLSSAEESARLVVFYTISTDWIRKHIDDLATSIEEQKNSNPLLAWYPYRKLNVQSGMQLEPELRPVYKIRARAQFDSLDEFFTISFYNGIFKLEEQDTISATIKTKMRLVEIPGGGDRVYFAAIQMEDGLSLRTDTTIHIGFHRISDPETEWSGHITERLPILSGFDYGGFIMRPRDKDSFQDYPLFTKEQVIRASDYLTIGDLAAAIATHPGMEVFVTAHVPKSGLKHELNTLRLLWQNRDTYTKDLQLLLANDFKSLDTISYFESDRQKYGAETVKGALDRATQRLSTEQVNAVNCLEKMDGGVFLVQGQGGTGKSQMLRSLVQYQYLLTAERDEPAAIWITSPINRQLDSLAESINNELLKTYDELRAEGKNPKIPIVIRRHMHGTEIKVYKMQNRKQHGVTEDSDALPYIKDQQSESLPLEAISTAMLLYSTFAESNATGFDKRLKHIALSEGQWLLRWVGMKDINNKIHPCAYPDREKYTELREGLDQLANGHINSKEEKNNLTLLVNQAIRDLAQRADVICQTPDVLSQERSHAASRPSKVLVDEAAKMNELAALAPLVFRTPYSRKNKEDVAVDPNTPVTPVVNFGDILQSKPMLTGTSHAFSEQDTLTLFSRLLRGGISSVTLKIQHRMAPDIAELVNAVLPYGQIVSAPGLEDRSAVKDFKNFTESTHGIKSSVLFISFKSNAVINVKSKSTYNYENVCRVTFYLLMLLESGIPAHDIGIAVPYHAQASNYVVAMYATRDWARKQEAFQHVADKVLDVEVFTIDGIQGGEKMVILGDTVVSGPLKFMRDTERLLLLISRPKAGLIIFGDYQSTVNHYRGTTQQRILTNSAYYKIARYCQENGCFIDLDTGLVESVSGNRAKPPYDVLKAIERVHDRGECDNTPLTLDTSGRYPLNLRSWAPEDTANNQGDNGFGGGFQDDNGGGFQDDNGGGWGGFPGDNGGGFPGDNGGGFPGGDEDGNNGGGDEDSNNGGGDEDSNNGGGDEDGNNGGGDEDSNNGGGDEDSNNGGGDKDGAGDEGFNMEDGAVDLMQWD